MKCSVIKKHFRVVGILLFLVAVSLFLACESQSEAAEKTIVSSKKIKKIKMSVGEKRRIVLKGKKGKASFSSTNKKVVRVYKSGKMQATGSGVAKIKLRQKGEKEKEVLRIRVKIDLKKKTVYGKVRGKELTNALVWYGVPYGASTAGENRWKAPKQPNAWSGTLSCTFQKPPAAQYGDGALSYTGTEDCLYVNVFRPKTTKKNLPVMVYLHGGGNASGNSSKDLSLLSKKLNAVVVSVEFRLGAFGFLNHPAIQDGTEEENSGNFTLLDIRESLRWVQSNIKNFGGNKNNVTLSGFSAGARNVELCVISPIMKGLFHKVITFSGAQTTTEPKSGEESANKKLAKILVKRGRYDTLSDANGYIESLSMSSLKKLFASLTTAEVANMYSTPMLRMNKFPQGFCDGVVIPKKGFQVIKSGKYNRVPMILGTNESEFSRYALFNLSSQIVESSSVLSSKSMMADAVHYGSLLQSNSYLEEPATRYISDSAHKAVYGYCFSWGERKSVTNSFYSRMIGANHGMDFNFLCENYAHTFSNFTTSPFRPKNEKGRKKLSAKMQKYMKNFLKRGNPNGSDLKNWKQWSQGGATGNILKFDATKRRAIIKKTTRSLSKDNIFYRMRTELSETRYNLLISGTLADRFFMPEKIPEYN